MSDHVSSAENNFGTGSRRWFLTQVVPGFVVAAIGAACAPIPAPSPPLEQSPQPNRENLQPTNEIIRLGTMQEHPLSKYGIKDTPDGHITYIELSGGIRRYFISGNEASYMFETKKGTTFAQTTDNAETLPRRVHGPDPKVEYKNGYSAITSIVRTDNANPNHLFAFTHNEQREIIAGKSDTGSFTASIGLLESINGGLTWTDKGAVIKGVDTIPPGKHVSGAGQPCAIKVGNDVFVYYIDWASQQKVQRADQIYLAKAAINSDGTIGEFQCLTNNGFQKEFAPHELKPVLPPPANIAGAGYTALPSISFNKKLNKLMCVFETNVGFCASTSENGIDWDETKMIARFPKPMQPRKYGDTWYSYPSLLSDNTENSDGTTAENGRLYFSRGIAGQTAQQLVSMPFNLV